MWRVISYYTLLPYVMQNYEIIRSALDAAEKLD